MIKFSKYTALGNDFVITKIQKVENKQKLAKDICSRRFGVGADGLILVEKSKKASIKMKYFNSDGTRGRLCGNGIRACAKFAYDNDLIKNKIFKIETDDGLKKVEILSNNKKESKVLVDMGKISTKCSDIPILSSKRDFFSRPILGGKFFLSVVKMGVPHGVIFVDQIEPKLTLEYGPIVENLSLFPHKINVNFVEIVNENTIKIETWERGCGRTLACGTGSCASAFVSNILYKTNKKVRVLTSSGHLDIVIHGQEIVMNGRVNFIFKGEF